MSTVHATRPPVQIPRDRDGYLIPHLLPVAAYLCAEEYPDAARSAALEALAAGRRPIACAMLGVLEWEDVLPVEELLAGRPPYSGRIAPVCGGAPASADAISADEWAAACAGAADWPDWTDDWRWVPTEPYQPTEEDERWLAAPYADRAHDFPRKYTPAEYRAALRALVADYVAD